MQRVVLHHLVFIALKDEGEELVMRIFNAVYVLLEIFIERIEILKLFQLKPSIETRVKFKKLKHLLSDAGDVERYHNISHTFFTQLTLCIFTCLIK